MPGAVPRAWWGPSTSSIVMSGQMKIPTVATTAGACGAGTFIRLSFSWRFRARSVATVGRSGGQCRGGAQTEPAPVVGRAYAELGDEHAPQVLPGPEPGLGRDRGERQVGALDRAAGRLQADPLHVRAG